jgi:hypothetical protein
MGLTVIAGVVAAGADSLVAVIVACPVPVAVTTIVAPPAVLTELAALTVSTAVLLDDQFTVRPARAVPFPFLGVAVRICVDPTIIGVVGADSVTEVTGAGVTVIGALPLFPSLAAEMLAVPGDTAVTSPVVDDTVATAVLSELQVTVRPVSVLPFASNKVAVPWVV